MDTETKNVFSQLLEALQARNEAEKIEDEKEATNEDVDKRDLIRQIMAIAGKHEDNEDVRTIAKLAEKLAYDKSEAGTADNSKAKNEECEETEAKEEKKEAANKCKNEDERDYKALYEELKKKVDKEAENKAKNSLDEAVNKIYSSLVPDSQDLYISSEKGLELGKQIYG